MKKTFGSENKQFAIECKGSLELKKFLVKYAASKDVPVYPTTLENINSDSAFSEYPNISWSDNALCGTGHFTADSSGWNNKTWISVETFMEYCDNWKECRPIEVKFKLNDNYTAIIDKEHRVINVGCQSFTFDIIEKLYKATQD